MRSAETLSAMPVPLGAVITTAELSRRPRRAPDFEAESRALGILAQTLATSPRSVLQKLTDVALQLCKAHSAGISLLEDDDGEPVLRWRALAGKFAPHLGSTLPRAFSPCGTVLDRNAIQLMKRPVRHFPHIEALRPGIEEALLVPFHLNRKPLGTIWVVAHDPTRRFDAEDARLITSLGKFAAAACEVLTSLELLESNLAERSRAADLAAAADRNKDRFIAVLAHELRSPLAPIRNAAELLKRETLDAAMKRQSSEIIDRHVRAMSRLIDDLLDVARLRIGNLQLRRTSVAVSEIVEPAVETAGPLVAARGHALVVSVPPEPIILDADVMRLCQVLQNLLSNAAKYTNPAGQIRIDARRDGDEVVVSVSDTGIGIAPDQLDAIFELYAQAGQAATERSAGGLGIGLYLARSIVEAHGGTIRALSAGPGRGSEFIVRLPCNPPAPAAAHEICA